MPELPEVETVRTGLEGTLKGAEILDVQLRRQNLRIAIPADFAAIFRGRTIRKVERRAKYLLFYVDSDDVLIAHLGMTGNFSVVAKKPVRWGKHDHAIFQLADGRLLIYNDARRFGLLSHAKKQALKSHPFFAGLGPEPLEKDFSPAYLRQKLSERKTPVKVALMDQALVVGVGNIYASEALFLAGIDPRKSAHKASRKAEAIIDSIRAVLRDAIASGGSSLRDFLHVSGETGYFQHHFRVYDRKGKPCVKCGSSVRSARLSGRSTFFCATCQK